MLGKLLRYDFKAVFRYWWIAAAATLGLSVVGGYAISVTSTEKHVPEIVMMLVFFAVMFTIVGIVAFPIFSYIMMFVRYYKNFFSDEGYLTFTLPVKRSELLNSKIITSVVTIAGCSAVIFLDIMVLCAIGIGEPFFKEFLGPLFEELAKAFAEMSSLDFAYLVLIIIELLMVAILGYVFFTLFMFACITFASVIVKKAKVITAIGIYYAASGAITTIVQLMFLFGTDWIVEQISGLAEAIVVPVVILILLTVVLLLTLVCVILYLLNYSMIDRKLNLQ